MNREDYRNMSVEERVKLVENLYISYPRLSRLIAKIEHCHRFSKVSAEAECMLILGETGTGKTTLFRRYEQRYPRFETKTGTTVPVLSASIPVPATIKSLVTRLLIRLGDPMAERGTTVSQTHRLQLLLGSCEAQILILDEFQHFIDRDSKKILQTASDWLKDVINETNIPVVLIGLPHSSDILTANPQLKRRFSTQERLAPFEWEDSVGKREFRKFLRTLDDQLPLAETSNLADEELAFRFYCASGGLISRIMKIVRHAVGLSLERGSERLTLEVLAESYAERLSEGGPRIFNPFEQDASDLEEWYQSNGSGGDFSDKPGDDETASDVFRRRNR
ncbi:MAG: TniB family NTP-binding protein [Acidobacteria bacterium]|nr:TniB family NTP-binding protein [Acidobacteriota bacterium]